MVGDGRLPREWGTDVVLADWAVDDEGFVAWRGQRLVDEVDLAEVQADASVSVPCTVEAFVRARAALAEADAPVLRERPRRDRGENFVLAHETRWHFEQMLHLELRFGVQAVWTLDGSRRFNTEDEVYQYIRAQSRGSWPCASPLLSCISPRTTLLSLSRAASPVSLPRPLVATGLTGSVTDVMDFLAASGASRAASFSKRA